MIEQRTPEWYEARRGHATASEADTILSEGKSKGQESAGRKNYRTQLVVERITGVVEVDGYVSKPMQWGIDHEPEARAWYMDKTDTLVSQLGFTRHPTIKWVGCSPDSEVEEGVGGLEIKCPNTAQHIATLLHGAVSYNKQLQFQMWVMGWKWNDFLSFDPRMPDHLKGVIIRVARDDKLIDEVIAPKTIALLNEVQLTIDELGKITNIRRAA